MLTKDQIEIFRRDGVLLLRGVLSPGEVLPWRDEVLAYFGFPSSPDEWRSAIRTYKSSSFHLSDEPTPETHAALKSIYKSLHATAEWSGHNELVLRAGNDANPWLGARAPHLDFPVYAPLRTLANYVMYLADVGERGGAFIYWPGSHHIAWDYFRRNPEDYLSRGTRSQDQTFAILKREMQGDPVEFVGNAGDLLIWHSLVFHSGSVNKRPETRIAMLGRWGVTLSDEPFYDFNADMWSYWDFREANPASGSRPLAENDS